MKETEKTAVDTEKKAQKPCKIVLRVMGEAREEEDAEPEKISMATTGTLRMTPTGWQIDYAEEQENHEKNPIRLIVDRGENGERVVMERKGSTATTMVFEKGHRFDGFYQTQYGALDLGLYANEVTAELADDLKGRIVLKYQLDLQGGFAAMHVLEVRFCPA